MAPLFVWGDNVAEVLGLNDEKQRETPVKLAIDEFNLEGLIKVSNGDNYSVALTKCGKIYTWGKNEDGGMLGQGDSDVTIKVPKVLESVLNYKIISIACGGFQFHTLAVTVDGSVF